MTTIDFRDGWMSLEPLARAAAPFTRSGVSATKQRDGTFLVSGVLARSPGQAAGVRPGDRITAVDGVPAVTLSGADFFELNRAAAGTKRTYDILRDGRHVRTPFRLRTLV